jgi:tetratricopeptide (TPR) repeat protein
MAYIWYANHLARLGRFDEAIAAVKRGLELDPLSLGIRWNVARQYYYARQYDEAIAQWRAIFELDPEYRAGRAYLIEAYEQKGLYDEALAEHLQELTDPAEVARLKAVYVERLPVMMLSLHLNRRYATEWIFTDLPCLERHG